MGGGERVGGSTESVGGEEAWASEGGSALVKDEARVDGRAVDSPRGACLPPLLWLTVWCLASGRWPSALRRAMTRESTVAPT
eukprot:scaffold6812_cov85-Isochrysis_galbana.AAC.3